MSSCSVIIVAEDGGALLFATIESVLRQENLTEIIVFDNGNSPTVMSRLQQRALSETKIRIISGYDSLLYSRCCNIAAKQASSDYLLFLKSNYLLAPDAITRLVDILGSEKKAFISSGVVQRYDNSYNTILRTKVVTPKTAFLDVISLRSAARKMWAKSQEMINERLEEQDKKPFDVVAVSSACICIKSSDFKKLGGFDEEYYQQDEELDLTLRAKQIGGRVLCDPTVKVTHLPDNNSLRLSFAQLLSKSKNLVRYIKKFFSGHYIIGTLFIINSLVMARAFIMASLCSVYGALRKKRDSFNTHFDDIMIKRLLILALGDVDLSRNKNLEKKIVLVTGATSQVGLCVIRRLIASGAAVLAISRSDEVPYYHSHLRWLKGDLTDHDVSLDGYCVDAVVHCAPLWQLPPLVEMLKESEAKRIIAISSTSVFTKLLSNNEFEKDFVLKLQAAEELLTEKCGKYGINYTVFRPTQIYGMGIDVRITNIAKIIRRFGFMCVYPPAVGRRQPVHADDVAIAIINSMENTNTYGKSYNLSGGQVLGYRDMLAKIFALYGKKVRVINSTMLPFILDIVGKISRKKHVNGEIARRMNDDLMFFHDDAKKDFGYSPRSFLSGGLKDIERF
ncbi:MAG: NAD-dependent epimerase/dehydratase family protein [Rickettsiales bacterium]